MAIGSNIALGDKLIKKTEPPKKIDKVIKVNKVDNVDNVDNKGNGGRDNATAGTVRTTFYVKKDMYKKLLSFAYWDRHNITEAINIALADGLKDKNTKDTPKE
jgi:hypothetical protein